MFLISWRSLGTARTEMTGMAGVSSFRRASQITPVCVSHLAPAEGGGAKVIKNHCPPTWMKERLHSGHGERRSSTFHVESVHVRALSGRVIELLLELLGHVHRQVHFVQGPLVLPRQSLHHR